MKVRNRPHWKQFSNELKNYSGRVRRGTDSLFDTRYKIDYKDYTLCVTRSDAFLPGIPSDYKLEFVREGMIDIDISEYTSSIRTIYNRVKKLYKNQDKIDKKNEKLAQLKLVEEKLFGIKQ
jgi:hypothetical protein